MLTEPEVLLRVNEVSDMVHLSRSEIYPRIKVQGPKGFPRPGRMATERRAAMD